MLLTFFDFSQSPVVLGMVPSLQMGDRFQQMGNMSNCVIDTKLFGRRRFRRGEIWMQKTPGTQAEEASQASVHLKAATASGVMT